MTTDSSFQQREADLIRDDIEGYLRQHEQKDMLRFLTAGSVDDGKSTLIGRLLYDSKMIYEDQLAAVVKDSAVHGTTNDDFDPALLTDGLKAEREQGITIDVAYRYFSTDKRNFIICDAPGHEQYTRNMATGASHCDLSIILIDARHGIMPQTKRHSFIASLLGIKHLVVCVNKMDIVDYSEEVYRQIRKDYEGFAAKLEVNDIHFMPISALKGDNVVDRSENMPWFDGAPLLSYLENVEVATDRNLIDLRFPVQYVLRPDLNFRGFSGTVASGIIRKGDEIMILPAGNRSTVKSIVTFEGEHDEAFAPMAVTVTLNDEIDASRGDMLVHVNNTPQVGNEFDSMLVWMSDDPLKPGTQLMLKSTSNLVPATVESLRYQFDVNTLKREQADDLQLNAIGRAVIHTHRPICYDSYSRNRNTGSFVLIDRLTNATLAAGMILDREPSHLVHDKPVSSEPKSKNIAHHESSVTTDERAQRLGQKPATVWLTGLPRSGKTTIAYALERKLFEEGKFAVVLDGENLRATVSADLGFSADDRRENVRRAAATAKLLNDAGIIAIVASVSPYIDDRNMAKSVVGDDKFTEVFVGTPLDVCKSRDPELYAKAESGEIKLFSGVTAPYEAPTAPSITLDTASQDPDACATTLANLLQ
jgi:bifunctional enzyme CysN/CysC